MGKPRRTIDKPSEKSPQLDFSLTGCGLEGQWLTLDLLRGLFSYDAENGCLVPKPGTRGVVSRRSYDVNGYRQWAIKGVSLREHRLVWWIVHGWEVPEVDHIDRIRSNSGIENLRPTLHGPNIANTPARNASGVKGVYWHKKSQKWQVQIQERGRFRHFGLFESLLDAVAVARREHIRIYGEFSPFWCRG